ncbi:hypothetical protein [Aliarcobacter butzleri]|uniref:hypothetical protein n=1 Tax=Aliarcobacter butzleri TaxID=28197 RepID=UPI0021B2CDD3|nr:hypothetical protein [Aliarcobacter butzleri]MCT7645547.1 hypothetical protein [Aliarcobacter butzleri]MDK2081612.1 hypothetical protein [Aliarcobacter butzleri]MDK2084027.1 hypothetical protein [Aliarcobacter butzleri]UXC30188.1 hypothetical protein N3114_04040 [Aliarcobacter butzleri]
MKKLVSLHKYWITADAIKHVVITKIEEDTSNLPNKIAEVAEIHSSFIKLSVLYGLIYVVIEGYKELKYTNEQIDTLLVQDSFVDALSLFRNSIFHYQKEPISEKALKFLELKESEIWIREIHVAFKLFFEKELAIKEVLEEINTNFDV